MRNGRGRRRGKGGRRSSKSVSVEKLSVETIIAFFRHLSPPIIVPPCLPSPSSPTPPPLSLPDHISVPSPRLPQFNSAFFPLPSLLIPPTLFHLIIYTLLPFPPISSPFSLSFSLFHFLSFSFDSIPSCHAPSASSPTLHLFVHHSLLSLTLSLLFPSRFIPFHRTLLPSIPPSIFPSFSFPSPYELPCPSQSSDPSLLMSPHVLRLFLPSFISVFLRPSVGNLYTCHRMVI